MLNKIHEITQLLTYSYTPENKNIIDNILNSTIERCESLYYKSVLYPQLETIWREEQNNNHNYYHLEKQELDNTIDNNNVDNSVDNNSVDNNSVDNSIISENSSTCTTPRSTISCSQFNYKTINKLDKFNKNKFKSKQQYILKDITVLIYIYVATQPISVFSGNQ